MYLIIYHHDLKCIIRSKSFSSLLQHGCSKAQSNERRLQLFSDLLELDGRRHRVPSLQNRRILFCVFWPTGAKAKRARSAGRSSPRATHASHSPCFRLCSPKIRTELRLFCTLQATYLSFPRF